MKSPPRKQKRAIASVMIRRRVRLLRVALKQYKTITEIARAESSDLRLRVANLEYRVDSDAKEIMRHKKRVADQLALLSHVAEGCSVLKTERGAMVALLACDRLARGVDGKSALNMLAIELGLTPPFSGGEALKSSRKASGQEGLAP